MSRNSNRSSSPRATASLRCLHTSRDARLTASLFMVMMRVFSRQTSRSVSASSIASEGFGKPEHESLRSVDVTNHADAGSDLVYVDVTHQATQSSRGHAGAGRHRAGHV